MQVLLSRVDHVGRAGVCGNGVCELGELVAVADDGTVAAGCAQDCPTPVLACPHDAQGVTCSGVPSTAQPSRHALHIPPQNSSSMRGGCPVTVSACM